MRRALNGASAAPAHLDLDDFHLEHERVTALDFRRAATVAIAKLRRDVPAR